MQYSWWEKINKNKNKSSGNKRNIKTLLLFRCTESAVQPIYRLGLPCQTCFQFGRQHSKRQELPSTLNKNRKLYRLESASTSKCSRGMAGVSAAAY